ncbi:hypothetical protein EDD15DRAFT_2196257 [Pisolithus albus]|nr:hypothetical protein EDD15DRAFT_2196257 [Pisolithus albus]
MPYTSFVLGRAVPTSYHTALPGGRPTANSLLQGAKMASVDYADVPGVSQLCVVFRSKTPLAEAAKAASVKLLVLAVKAKFTGTLVFLRANHHRLPANKPSGYVKSLGIPVLRIHNGMFMEFIPWLTGVKPGKFHLLGQQNKPSSFASLDDGERTSLEAIGALYEARIPPVPVVHVNKLPDGFDKQTFLQTNFTEGRLSAG